MAQRRMFSKTIVESDEFLDMSLTTQALYFHLGIQADDDGFVSPNRIMRMIGANADDLKVMIAKKLVIPFESGVVVIRHWKENNYIQNDRKKDTVYLTELAKLSEEKNGVYIMDTKCIQNVHVGKVSIGKERLGKESIVKVIEPLIEQLKAFENEYSKSLLTDFELYWGETTSGGKARWQLEKTWDLKKRILKWKRNQEKWDYEKSQRFIKKVEELRPREERVDSGLSKIDFSRYDKS